MSHIQSILSHSQADRCKQRDKIVYIMCKVVRTYNSLINCLIKMSVDCKWMSSRLAFCKVIFRLGSSSGKDGLQVRNRQSKAHTSAEHSELLAVICKHPVIGIDH